MAINTIMEYGEDIFSFFKDVIVLMSNGWLLCEEVNNPIPFLSLLLFVRPKELDIPDIDEMTEGQLAEYLAEFSQSPLRSLF